MKHVRGDLIALLAVVALALAGEREATAGPCKADGQRCRTSRSCCGTSGNNGVCVKASGARFGVCCTPDCTAKECGDDGCGGSCGTCTAPETCGGGGTPDVCGTTTTTTTSTTSTSTTSLPMCSVANLACLCDNRFAPFPCNLTPCTTPTSCAQCRAAQVQECVDILHSGPGTCVTAPCTECATGNPCM